MVYVLINSSVLHKISYDFTHVVYDFTSFSLRLVTKKNSKGDETCGPNGSHFDKRQRTA